MRKIRVPSNHDLEQPSMAPPRFCFSGIVSSVFFLSIMQADSILHRVRGGGDSRLYIYIYIVRIQFPDPMVGNSASRI